MPPGGPRFRAVYHDLLAAIDAGRLPAGTRLASQATLARQYGVAPTTVRRVLARLEAEGRVRSEHGCVTVSFPARTPRVLVVDDDRLSRVLLRENLRALGFAAVEAADPDEALALLDDRGPIHLILTDIRMPVPQKGVLFLWELYWRHTSIPVVVVASEPSDIDELRDAPEWPVMVISKPFTFHDIERAVAFALRPREPSALER